MLTLEAQFQNVFGVSAAPALEALALEEIELINDNRGEVFAMKPMDKEIYQWDKITGLPRFSLTGEGEQAQTEGFVEVGLKTYTAIKYAEEIAITQEMIEDSRFDLIERQVRALANAGSETQMYNAWNLFNNAFSSETSYDGVALISASHPSPVGNQSNLETAADLDVTPLKTAEVNFLKIVDERGKRLNVRPERLIVPADLVHTAIELTESPFLPNGANNNVNSIKKYSTSASPYIVDADSWFLQVPVGSKSHGLKIMERRPLSRKLHEDQRAEVMYYVSSYRQAIGADEWRGIRGNTGQG